MFINRSIVPKMQEMLTKFPIVSLNGPRQSGKSTILKEAFSDFGYISLEDPDILYYAKNDPRGLLNNYDKPLIIDEAQNNPDLFSYLQTVVDETNDSGQYILSGSQNFLLMEKISQSLAGRVYIMTLLPLSYNELAASNIGAIKTEHWVHSGGFPRIYDKDINPEDYYPSYLQTYVERDIRSIKKITDLNKFDVFVRMCATRIGQVLNISSLANDCGISPITANEWLSVLESSYIIHMLRPYYNNYNKRLVKSPKLYFCDTGLACSLLGIGSERILKDSPMYGQLFENMVIMEQLKDILSTGSNAQLYFWRDSNGNEVDLLKEQGNTRELFEIKSSMTMNPDFSKTLTRVGDLIKAPTEKRFVIYDGDKTMTTSSCVFRPWNI